MLCVCVLWPLLDVFNSTTTSSKYQLIRSQRQRSVSDAVFFICSRSRWFSLRFSVNRNQCLFFFCFYPSRSTSTTGTRLGKKLPQTKPFPVSAASLHVCAACASPFAAWGHGLCHLVPWNALAVNADDINHTKVCVFDDLVKGRVRSNMSRLECQKTSSESLSLKYRLSFGRLSSSRTWAVDIFQIIRHSRSCLFIFSLHSSR